MTKTDLYIKNHNFLLKKNERFIMKEKINREKMGFDTGRRPDALRKSFEKVGFKLGDSFERWELELLIRCSRVPSEKQIPPEGIRWSILEKLDEQYHRFSRIGLEELASKRLIKKYPVSNERYQYLMPDDMQRLTDWRYGRLNTKDFSKDHLFPRYGEQRAYRQFNLLTPASSFPFTVPEEGMKISYCCQLFRLFQEIFKSHEIDLVWRTREYLEGKKRGFIQYTQNNIIDLINDCEYMKAGDELEILYSSRCANLLEEILKKFIIEEKFDYIMILKYSSGKRIRQKIRRRLDKALKEQNNNEK